MKENVLKFLAGGYFIGEAIFPYWLDTPNSKGYGYIKVSVGSASGGSRYWLCVEELKFKVEKYGSLRLKLTDDESVFENNPYEYLKLKDEVPLRRKMQIQITTNCGPFYSGLQFTDGGGLLFNLYERMKLKLAHSQSWLSGSSLSVEGTLHEIQGLVSFLQTFFNNVVNDRKAKSYLRICY